MKVVPMIFNTDMVSALVNGRKTVTRRPLKMPEGWELKDSKLSKISSSHPKKGKWGALIRRETFRGQYQHDIVPAPCFVGDLIYVRETFRLFERSDECVCSDYCSCPPSGTPIYFADVEDGESVWKPSIHMPRKASRLTLKVTDLRIEKAQEITTKEAMMEGISHHSMSCPKAEFGQLWNEIYGNWTDNPYVWVIEFEVIHANVDIVIAREKSAAEI